MSEQKRKILAKGENWVVFKEERRLGCYLEVVRHGARVSTLSDEGKSYLAEIPDSLAEVLEGQGVDRSRMKRLAAYEAFRKTKRILSVMARQPERVFTKDDFRGLRITPDEAEDILFELAPDVVDEIEELKAWRWKGSASTAGEV